MVFHNDNPREIVYRERAGRAWSYWTYVDRTRFILRPSKALEMIRGGARMVTA